MKSEEKAQELFNKYFLLHESATDENGVWILSALNKGLAKKCALIAVENEYYSLREMLIHFQGTKVINDGNFYLKFLQKLIDEEQDVKQEIEKL
jgi:hypothetical protein